MARLIPRKWALLFSVALFRCILIVFPKHRRTAYRNIELVFPESTEAQKEELLQQLCNGLVRMLIEMCHFPEYTEQNVADHCIHDGLENYLAARDKGKGVLVLTGHFGGWEVGCFAHSIYGYPMHILVRAIDNPLIEGLARNYRERFGNKTIDGRSYARAFIKILKSGGTLGVLADTNVTPPRGIFANFFGIPARTSSSIAKLAWHTGAAVVPGYTVWDEKLGKYRVIFLPEVPLRKTNNEEADILANTESFNRILEDAVRQYPGQWLWVHRRWKTRPEGEVSLY